MKKKLSKVADAGACPKCGGSQFVPKRSLKGKMAGGVLAPKSRVKCITCGKEYKRG